MRPFGRRTSGRLARLSAFAVLAFALVVSGAGPASAGGDNGNPDSTGNNGTLKILAYGSDEASNDNEPHVCAFKVEGFNFDPGQQLAIAFLPQAPTKDVVPPEPNLYQVTADGEGYFITDAYGWFNGEGGAAFAAGHYKVVALGKDTGSGPWTELDKAKSKVFWVDCGAPVGDVGSLTVTKALAEGSAPAHKPFAITVVCEKGDYNETFEFTLAVGASKELTGLPVGAVCTVSEKTTDGWQPPDIAPNPVTVKKDATVAVTVTNFKPKPEGEGQTGTVTVTKQLAEGSAEPAAGQTFPVTVTCEKHEKEVYDNTFDLAVGASATTHALPVGTKCTVSEEPPDGWNVPTFEPKATVTVKKDTTTTVTVLNFRSEPTPPPQDETGTVKVTKALAADSGDAGDQRFPMTVTCEKAGYSQTFEFDLAVGESNELTKLPDGAVCTVSETVPSGWEDPTYSPAAAVTVIHHATVEVTVVNSRTVVPPTPWATLTLDKSSPQATALLGGTVTYNLTVKADGNVTQTNVMVSDPIPAGTTYVVGSAACVGDRTPCARTEPTASDPTVSWALGTMDPGETVTVTFQVTVSSALQPGSAITNVGYVESDQASAKDELVLPTAEVEGEVIVGPTTPTVTPAVVEGETLPATGASVPVGSLVGTGLGLVAFGALLTALSRRRRDSA